MKTTKRITVPALIVWTALIVCLVGWHFAAIRLPVLATRPLTDIWVLVAVAGAASVQSLMRTVPIQDALPSRSNSPFVNVVYAANLILGLMGILSLLYILGFLGREKPMVTLLALSNLGVSILLQVVILGIPTGSSR